MIKRYIMAGLLVWLPIWITFLVIKFLIDLFDSTLKLFPAAYQPDALFGFHIPGLGLVFSLLVMLITGLVVTNYFGRHLVHYWESMVGRIPLVRTIHQAVKQVLHTFFSASGDSFRRVYLVEYPRQGLWSIAFQTGTGFPEATNKLGEPLITIVIPTTPNPTSGFLMLIPRKDAIELSMSVDQAVRFIISLGVVVPEESVETLQQLYAVDPDSLPKS